MSRRKPSSARMQLKRKLWRNILKMIFLVLRLFPFWPEEPAKVPAEEKVKRNGRYATDSWRFLAPRQVEGPRVHFTIHCSLLTLIASKCVSEWVLKQNGGFIIPGKCFSQGCVYQNLVPPNEFVPGRTQSPVFTSRKLSANQIMCHSAHFFFD